VPVHRYPAGAGVRIAEVSIVETPALPSCRITQVDGEYVKREPSLSDIARLTESLTFTTGRTLAASMQEKDDAAAAREAQAQAEAEATVARYWGLMRDARALRDQARREHENSRRKGSSSSKAFDLNWQATLLEIKAKNLLPAGMTPPKLGVA
jgi:hypothetical protein